MFDVRVVLEIIYKDAIKDQIPCYKIKGLLPKFHFLSCKIFFSLTYSYWFAGNVPVSCCFLL